MFSFFYLPYSFGLIHLIIFSDVVISNMLLFSNNGYSLFKYKYYYMVI